MALFAERKDTTFKVVKKTFGDRVVELALGIPAGRVTSYKELARAAGGGGMSHRSVTGILGKAWKKGEKNIPWHRIVYSDGHVWISPANKKQRLLLYKKEKIVLDKKNRIVDFMDKFHEF